MSTGGFLCKSINQMVGHTKRYVSCQSESELQSVSLRTKEQLFKNTHVIQQTVFIITKEHLAGTQHSQQYIVGGQER